MWLRAGTRGKALAENRYQFDPLSSTWGHVKFDLTARLATYRAELEAEDIDERRSDVVRGHIAEIKSLLNMDNPEPDLPPAGKYA